MPATNRPSLHSVAALLAPYGTAVVSPLGLHLNGVQVLWSEHYRLIHPYIRGNNTVVPAKTALGDAEQIVAEIVMRHGLRPGLARCGLVEDEDMPAVLSVREAGMVA